MSAAPVIFLTGAPGVGKSTVARALAERFDRSFLIDLDSLRASVIRGLSQPSAGWSDETTLQFDLAHQAAGKLARLYSEAGFAVIVAHCSAVEHVAKFEGECPGAAVICLHADLATNVKRNNTRSNKSFDPTDIEFFVFELAPSMHVKFLKAGYRALDSTSRTVCETADAVLAASNIY